MKSGFHRVRSQFCRPIIFALLIGHQALAINLSFNNYNFFERPNNKPYTKVLKQRIRFGKDNDFVNGASGLNLQVDQPLTKSAGSKDLQSIRNRYTPDFRPVASKVKQKIIENQITQKASSEPPPNKEAEKLFQKLPLVIAIDPNKIRKISNTLSGIFKNLPKEHFTDSYQKLKGGVAPILMDNNRSFTPNENDEHFKFYRTFYLPANTLQTVEQAKEYYQHEDNKQLLNDMLGKVWMVRKKRSASSNFDDSETAEQHLSHHRPDGAQWATGFMKGLFKSMGITGPENLSLDFKNDNGANTDNDKDAQSVEHELKVHEKKNKNKKHKKNNQKRTYSVSMNEKNHNKHHNKNADSKSWYLDLMRKLVLGIEINDLEQHEYNQHYKQSLFNKKKKKCDEDEHVKKHQDAGDFSMLEDELEDEFLSENHKEVVNSDLVNYLEHIMSEKKEEDEEDEMEKDKVDKPRCGLLCLMGILDKTHS